MMTDGKEEGRSAYHALTRRRQRFVDEYVACGVGAEAYRRVWPNKKRPDSAAYKLLQLAEIRSAIQERTDQAIYEAGATHKEVLVGLLRIAKFDQRKLYKNGVLRQAHELEDEVALALGGIEVIDTPLGPVRKYHQESRTRALELVGKYLGMWKERTEVSGPNGGPVEIKNADELSDDELAAIVARGRRTDDPEET